LALVTGSLWGRPMWGTYWEWDARMTSVLILFLMYLGLIALWRSVEDPARAARAAAVLTLVGAINLPIIKFSVDWWNTLHQPASVLRAAGPALDKSFLIPLLIMAVAFSLLFVTLHLAAMRNEILRRRVRTLRMMLAAQAAACCLAPMRRPSSAPTPSSPPSSPCSSSGLRGTTGARAQHCVNWKPAACRAAPRVAKPPRHDLRYRRSPTGTPPLAVGGAAADRFRRAG